MVSTFNLTLSDNISFSIGFYIKTEGLLVLVLVFLNVIKPLVLQITKSKSSN